MDAYLNGMKAAKSLPAESEDNLTSKETTRGGREAVKWVKVTTTAGTPNAVIIAGRLEAEGIPTRITQEALGSSVIIVNVGILGVATIWVPQEHQSRAAVILAEEWEAEDEGSE